MKKIYLYLSLILFSGGIILSSCGNDTLDESIPLNPVLTPFKTVTAEDGSQTVNASISDNNRTIVFEFNNLKNLEEVEVKLDVSKRAELYAPADTVMTLDLTEPYELTVNNLYDDVTYTITASIPEFILIDKSQFEENNLANDPKYDSPFPMSSLWNNRYIKTVGDYGSVNYENYIANPSFTFDIGTRYDGSYYYIKQMRVNLYRAYSWTCPKIYELWGYMSEGEPPADGDWTDWTKLATINNSDATEADFPEGDNVHFEKGDSPQARYLRIKCIENWKPNPDTYISIGELTFWAWNK